MKTSVIMEREMTGLKIRQDSKDMFFNATDLLDAYNTRNNEGKRIYDYLHTEAARRFMNALAKAENENNEDSRDLENALTKAKNQEFCLIRTKRGKYGGTWMNPYLFIDFAMWLSPEFKVTVIRWVYDNLIKLRHEAGDSFKEVNEALFDRKPNSAPFEYANEAKMINKIVFGSAAAGQRNNATEEQLALLKALQKADVKLIQEGKDYFERFQDLSKLSKYL